jgi:hypothetical protein
MKEAAAITVELIAETVEHLIANPSKSLRPDKFRIAYEADVAFLLTKLAAATRKIKKLSKLAV